MDYLNFFGFKEDPFKLTPDPAYFYPSSSHNEGLLLMDYSIEQKEGFLLIIGDPGTGKTTLLNVFLEKWKSRAEIAIILTPRLSPEEFLISVAEDLNIKFRKKNKNEIIKVLRDFMIKKSSEDKRIVIVVDEAQNLPDETLEELRLLSNLETDKDKLLQIILIGQPELESRLTAERLRQLNQRITTRIYLRHFNHGETADYINHRLIKAGKINLKIDKKAGRLVHKLSHGIPRLINMLISRALMAAYLEESNIISQRHVTHAVKSLNHSELRISGQKRLAPIYAGLSLVILVGIGGYLYFQNTYIRPQISDHRPVLSKGQEIEVKSQNEDKKLGRWEDDKPKDTTSQPLNFSTSGPIGTQLQTTVSPASPAPVKEVHQNTEAEKNITVKVDIANIRELPSITSRKVGRSLRGNQFVILRESSDESNIAWYQVLYEGEKRWISQEVVKAAEIKE